MKKASKSWSHRPPLQRMLRIHDLIKSGKYPNAVTMAKTLEVTKRTVKRDIDYMRDQHGAPIEYHQLKYGYFYAKPYESLPVAAVSEKEMFALLVADKAIAQYRGMPFQPALQMAFKKLTGQLDGQQQYSLENLGLAFSFRPFAPEDADLNAFRVVTKALQESRVLQFNYRNLGTKNWQARTVHPYHLACIDSHWYLFAHDVNRKDVRTFALTRLAKPTLTKDRFKKSAKFDPDKYLEGSFAVMKGDKEYVVEIEFDGWAADLLQGRQWHSSQDMTALRDGAVRLRMRLSSLEEIERWILSWGTHVRVVGPAALVERVRKVGKAVSKLYGATKS